MVTLDKYTANTARTVKKTHPKIAFTCAESPGALDKCQFRFLINVIRGARVIRQLCINKNKHFKI